MNTSENEWPFDQEKNVAAVTTKQVVDQGLPILLVIHYEDDHSWAFLCDTTEEESDSQLITMEEITLIDPTLHTIADLKPGWIAYRETIDDAWETFENKDASEDEED